MRAAVVYWASDGRGIYSLNRQQAADLDLLMRRYYRWERSGRDVDPWQSGAAGATRYDIPRSRVRPIEGYGPGRASEPDVPDDLEAIHAILATLPLAWRHMFAWRWDDGIGRQAMAERLTVSLDQYRSEWKKARTTLYCRIFGL